MGEKDFLLGVEKACTLLIGDSNYSIDTLTEVSTVLTETQKRLKRLENPDQYETRERSK